VANSFSYRFGIGQRAIAALGGPTPPPNPAPTAPGFGPGINLGYWQPWSNDDPTRDRALLGTWVWQNGERQYQDIARTDLNMANGAPLAYLYGATQIALKLWENCRPARTGLFRITYPAAMTATISVDGGATIIEPPANGVAIVDLPASERVSCGIILSGAIPAGGPVVTARLVGDTSTLLVTDEMVADVAPFDHFRTMPALDINNLKVPAPSAALQQLASRAAMPAVLAELANRAAGDIQINIPINATDDYVEATAVQYAAHLAQVRRALVELSNEDWNISIGSGGGEKVRWKIAQGAALGYHNTPIGSPLTNIDTTDLIDGTLPAKNYAAGQLICVNRYGHGVAIWEALQAVTANNSAHILPHPATSNAFWTMRADAQKCARAADFWHADRAKFIWETFEAKLGVGRVIRVMNIQQDTSNERMEQMGARHDLWRMPISWQDAPYIGGGGFAPALLGSYADNHIDGWGATEKALYATNPTVWADKLNDALFAQIAPGIAGRLAFKARFDALWTGAPYNLPAGHHRLDSYEVEHHVVLFGYPNHDLALAAHRTWRTSQRRGPWLVAFAKATKLHIGGRFTFYRAAGNTWGNNDLQFWGIRPWTAAVAEPAASLETWISAGMPT
jgi:hypothetical protein